MPTNWKYIKKQLEKEFLCDSLKKQVTYDLTQYDPAPWYQQHFIIKHGDNTIFESFQSFYYADSRYVRPEEYREPSRIILQRHLSPWRMDEKEFSKHEILWQKEQAACEEYAHSQGIYGVEEIVYYIGVYLHSSISDSLNSDEYFIRALAILDRRVGKRTLEKLAKEDTNIPDWLKRIYRVRFEAEGIRYSDFYK